MTELTLAECLTPVGHEPLFSFRQQLLANFATTAGQLWPEVRVPADMDEAELWPHLRQLTELSPNYSQVLKEKHAIVHAWIYGRQ